MKKKPKKTTKMAKSTKLKSLKIPDCRHFHGYKPCFPGTDCLEECADPSPRGKRILIINLEAMGNVLVTTTLLPELKRRHPVSTITWITLGNAHRLLDNNPLVDEVLLWEPESWLKLGARKFDIALNIDKAKNSCAFIMSVNATKKAGYGLNADGVIVPLNREAEYNYRLGLSDHLKFRVNQKPNTQLLSEAMGLTCRRDEYILNLSPAEQAFCRTYRQEVVDGGSEYAGRIVVGFNTGCSNLYPNKKMTLDQHVVLINELAADPRLRILLLGGPEDTERNEELVRRVGDRVVNTPTTEGVRRGLCYINLCDVVISGDSFGMHASIGLKKYMIVWFGLTCPQEIDLFDRGIKLIPEGLTCAPCWKRECPYNLECIQMIDLDAVVAGVKGYADRHHAE
ncbi:MAG TPA: glycosyltransferase family 9 protein [Bacteroidota bacterium]|nr:glycosyltransferase family 9 protein [Bacteroidota bacterium]